MANTKQVHIGGVCPFNLAQHDHLVVMLGLMNTPCFGLKITYSNGSVEMRPNEHGGKTAMYRFDIQGTEAVATGWLQSLVENLKYAGSSVTECSVYDIDGQENIRLNL